MITQVNLKALAAALKAGFPSVLFAFVHGSAQNGVVKAGSDLDLALYFRERPGLEDLTGLTATVQEICPNVPCDIGSLNFADPVYCFEALSGRRLFVRDFPAYLDFFSLTCRRYEAQAVSYARQKAYRLEALRGY